MRAPRSMVSQDSTQPAEAQGLHKRPKGRPCPPSARVPAGRQGGAFPRPAGSPPPLMMDRPVPFTPKTRHNQDTGYALLPDNSNSASNTRHKLSLDPLHDGNSTYGGQAGTHLPGSAARIAASSDGWCRKFEHSYVNTQVPGGDSLPPYHLQRWQDRQRVMPVRRAECPARPTQPALLALYPQLSAPENRHTHQHKRLCSTASAWFNPDRLHALLPPDSIA